MSVVGRVSSFWCFTGALCRAAIVTRPRADSKSEDAEQAAMRELREELGLDATGRFWPVRYQYGYAAAEEPPERRAQWPPGTERIAVTGFIVEAPPDFEPSSNWEHDDYRWCSLDEAVALFYWPDVGEALEELWRRAG